MANAPEFFWELELKRLAKEFPAPEKLKSVEPAEVDMPMLEDYIKQASAVDIADFEAAVSQGKITPGDKAEALAQHKAAREIINASNEATTAVLGAEFDSEFADYHRGAFAFRKGEASWADARTSWEKLLARPKEQRHFRTTWAAFMLGKLMVFKKEPGAAKQMALVRQLAAEGFADSLGLAADSYGWEAKAMLDQGDVGKAAELYLKQLSVGDESAIVSLKACVPDRVGVDGMLNFDNTSPGSYETAAVDEWRKTRLAQIENAAKHPLLRRITTAHILATETVDFTYMPEHTSARSVNWLEAIKKAGLEKVEDADRLGWVAYSAGRYDEAEGWLKKSDATTATALWLKSKLLRRAGKVTEASKVMAEAFVALKADNVFGKLHAYLGQDGMSYSPLASAGGDLAALRLTTGDFLQAFDAFLETNHWDDASYIAERVLTADELKKYVEEHPNKQVKTNEWDEPHDLRYLLGRRLVREDRYKEARDYLPEQMRATLDRYVEALNKGANTKLSKEQRARAWWDAAVLARFSGMELMGTEVEPDAFVFGGSFEAAEVADERAAGTFEKVTWQTDGNEKKEVLPLVIKASEEEKKRVSKHRPTPNKRFHYRYIAAGLAWKAAQLLPDQSEALADVLNSAGGWIKNDSAAADKFFQAIERRASKTNVGKAAGKAHWFVKAYGPWSEAPKEE